MSEAFLSGTHPPTVGDIRPARETLRVVEQGLSFTVVEAPHPMDDAERISSYNARRQFTAAHRVWLGGNSGTDWLHDAVEAEFGEDVAWYDVESKRDATHIGAAGEVAAVVLILMGAGAADMLRTYYKAFAQRLGEASADALLEWARERSREHRKARGIEDWDGPPDFLGDGRDVKWLAVGMADELADVLGVPAAQLELVSAERRKPLAMYAIYRDVTTGDEFSVEVGRDSATFRRLGGGTDPQPTPRPSTAAKPPAARPSRLPWRR